MGHTMVEYHCTMLYVYVLEDVHVYHGEYTCRETGGYINRRAHLFLVTLPGSQGCRPAADSRTQGYFRGPSPQDVALRG
jgi:hypothetical protein